MPQFTEAQLEQSIIELVKRQGYTYIPGETISRDTKDILLRDDLSLFLRERYKDEGITDLEVEMIVHLFEHVQGSLYNANREALNMISSGFSIRREDKTKPNLYVYLIDFEDVEKNSFKIVNQLEVAGETTRIPDAILYVNGIPLVVLEFKSAIKEDVTIEDAYTQLTVRYRRDIPELFKYNAFVVISDGVNSKFGSLFAPYDYFYAWRKVDPKDSVSEGIQSLYTMVEGLFRPDRLLAVVKDFIYFPDSSKSEQKFVCRYPQYFAATELYNNILEHSRLNPGGDGKGGTYFGATGCGKSLTMLYLSRLLMKSTALSSPTILLITDRNDLDAQLSQTFLRASNFIGDKTIKQVESRAQLQELLQGRTSGGVFLTTIQKFTEDTGLLSNRTNIICISDEAHRSQTNLEQQLSITDQGVRRHYGFAKYLHDSLPGATYVGFTGTPIDPTIDVFGPVVDAYTMAESVSDEITRRIVYEGRASKVILENETVQQIEKYYAQCEEEGATEYQIETSKKAMASMEVLLSDEKLISRIVTDFLQHYEGRVSEGSTVEGKAMFVCASRKIAWMIYKEIIARRPNWAVPKVSEHPELLTEDELKTIRPCEKVKMVITRNKDDEESLYNLLGNDDYRRDLADQFKDVRSNFKIAIVVDMWITGFDVPALDTMYIFKPLQRHTLIQTISRVNRVYPGKDKGLVVDYIGIRNNMNKAIRQYGAQAAADSPVDSIEKSLNLLRDELDILRRIIWGFDYSIFHTGSPLEQLDCLNRAADFILGSTEKEHLFMAHTAKMSSAYSLCSSSESVTKEEVDDIHFFKAVRSIIYKLVKGESPDATKMNAHVANLIKQAFLSEQVEEITSVGFGADVQIDVLSEEYLERLKRINLENTKVKLIEKLLRQVIDNLSKVNKVRSTDFTKRLNEIVRRYNDRTDNSAIASDVVDEVVGRMEELLHEINGEKTEAEKLGVTYEEKAFYDILKSVRDKFGFEYPEDKLIYLAKEVKKIVDDKSRFVDWSTRADIRSKFKVEIVILLSKNHYPPYTRDEVFKEILEQAENFKKYSVKQ